MGFPLVPKLVTLNDLEPRNGRPYLVLFHRSRHCIFGATYVTVTKHYDKKKAQKIHFLVVYDLWRYSYRLLRRGALKIDLLWGALKRGTPHLTAKFELCNIVQLLQMPLTHASEIGATGLNSTPDSGASFSCRCATSTCNIIDCLLAQKAVNNVRSRASARKLAPESGVEFMGPISGAGFFLEHVSGV